MSEREITELRTDGLSRRDLDLRSHCGARPHLVARLHILRTAVDRDCDAQRDHEHAKKCGARGGLRAGAQAVLTCLLSARMAAALHSRRYLAALHNKCSGKQSATSSSGHRQTHRDGLERRRPPGPYSMIIVAQAITLPCFVSALRISPSPRRTPSENASGLRSRNSSTDCMIAADTSPLQWAADHINRPICIPPL